MKMYELKIYDKVFSAEELYESCKQTINLSEPLRGLPNGVKDKIIKKNNGQWNSNKQCSSDDLIA